MKRSVAYWRHPRCGATAGRGPLLEIRGNPFLNPMRYFLVVIRGTYLKGVGMDILWPQMAAMAVLGVALLTTAILRFHKALD